MPRFVVGCPQARHGEHRVLHAALWPVHDGHLREGVRRPEIRVEFSEKKEILTLDDFALIDEMSGLTEFVD